MYIDTGTFFLVAVAFGILLCVCFYNIRRAAMLEKVIHAMERQMSRFLSGDGMPDENKK